MAAICHAQHPAFLDEAAGLHCATMYYQISRDVAGMLKGGCCYIGWTACVILRQLVQLTGVIPVWDNFVWMHKRSATKPASDNNG